MTSTNAGTPATGTDRRRFLVVGAGLAGASAAWHLARRGHAVTVAERDVPASAAGSSHGSARILRFAYPDADYVQWVQEATAGWRELEGLTGSPILTPTTALDFGITRDPAGLAGVLAATGVAHEMITAARARDRWPGLNPDTDVLVHDGWVIDAEGTVHAMLEQAVRHGARVENGFAVTQLTRTASGLQARAADGRTVEADHVVVAAGGWLPDLLDGLDLPAEFRAGVPGFTVREENAFHFPYRDPQAARWPTLIHKRPQMSVYSLPGDRDAEFRGQKIAQYEGGPVIGSAAHRTGGIDPANRARVVEYVKEFLPGLVPQPYAETTCLFTTTPSEDFVVDTADGVTLLAACSGHGAKFAPLLGRWAADTALAGVASVPRFRVGQVRAGV